MNGLDLKLCYYVFLFGFSLRFLDNFRILDERGGGEDLEDLDNSLLITILLKTFC